MLTVFRSTKRKLDAPELPERKAARRLTFSQGLPPAAEPECLPPAPSPTHSASDDAPPSSTPQGTPRAAVSVDPLVKRVYTVVHETTFLDWGLTSEWALTTPGRTRQCASATSAASTPSRSAVKDGNAASEGYGEVTAGSLQHVLNYLAHLRRRALDAGGEESAAAALLTPSHEVGAESTLVDVGSGYGKVVFHAALSGLFKRAHGVEYVQSRHALATQVHRSLATAAKSPKLSARLGGSQACVQVAGAMRRVSLACGDATAGPLHFSHVYMYDKVFNTATSQALAQQLNASRFRVLVTFRSASSWAALGLRHCVQVGTLVMRTTGGQSFRCYVLANTREWE